MPLNHALLKGKLQVQWGPWESKKDFFVSRFFSPSSKLRRKNLCLSERSFLIFFYFRKKNPSSFFGITALAFSLCPSVDPAWPWIPIRVRGIHSAGKEAGLGRAGVC